VSGKNGVQSTKFLTNWNPPVTVSIQWQVWIYSTLTQLSWVITYGLLQSDTEIHSFKLLLVTKKRHYARTKFSECDSQKTNTVGSPWPCSGTGMADGRNKTYETSEIRVRVFWEQSESFHTQASLSTRVCWKVRLAARVMQYWAQVGRCVGRWSG
jgi:hypothetical protein